MHSAGTNNPVPQNMQERLMIAKILINLFMVIVVYFGILSVLFLILKQIKKIKNRNEQINSSKCKSGPESTAAMR